MIWFLNGKYIPSHLALIPIADISVLRGYGVFDFLVTYKQKPFMLTEHVDRLFASASKIGLKVPYTRKEISGFVLRLIAKNKDKAKDFTLRLVVTGGVSSSNLFPEGKANTAILIEKRMPYPASCYNFGIKLKSFEYLRPFASAKHIDYLTAAVEKRKANKAGFLEVLYTCDGRILECTTSNFYLVQNGVVITPKADILHGITKKVVLNLARKHFKVEEREVLMSELSSASEVFISASDKEIMPVIKIDGFKIGPGAPGPVCQKIMTEFKKITRS